MPPDPAFTLRWSCKAFLLLWLLGMVLCKPAGKSKKDKENTVPGAKHSNKTVPACPEFDFKGCDFVQKLCDDDYQTYPMGDGSFGTIVWKSDLTDGESGARRGVILVEPTSDVQVIKIFIGLQKPKNWCFGISELHQWEEVPQPANGDAAEIHNWNKDLIIYENEKDVPQEGYFGRRVPLNYFGEYFEDKDTSFEVTLTRDRVVLETQPHIKGTHDEFQDKPLFTFNYGLAIGINRDPADPPSWAKSGTGVYAVCVKLIGQKRNPYWY